MSTDEQAPASGSVPNAYGNALAWKWVPSMPAALKRAHVHTLLYALRSMASASGELRFGDRKPMRIKDIARAAGCDEKDCRDRLDASIKAGVLRVVGERRRGRTALYVLLPTPFPDWSAAVAHLAAVKEEREAARQKREAERKAAPWSEENGGRSPELDDTENGGPPPELTDGTAEEERGTAPRPRTGDRPPNGSGDRPPYTPGGYPWGSHDGAEVGFQPQVVGPPGDQAESHEPPPDDQAPPPPDPDDYETWHRCPVCRHRVMPSPWDPTRTVHPRCEPQHATTDHGRHTA
ncbi:hypothetical protein G3M58_36870 [Streptomyces sp. SID7499]|uniref:Uncharacterized protein n=1 Tax=Streptomyces sp. SID7499 TaxID=2706086 RepID=A0A6G3X2Z2_9ACTN|nr:hypothetical protein [Streptomyces sp. SID7499]